MVKFPVWMHSRFHFTVWGRMISLCERMKLFESITEMLILDIDLHCHKSIEAAIEAGEEAFKEDIQTDRISPAKELMRQLRDKVIALANNSILPLNFQCTVWCAHFSISNLLLDQYL